MRTKQKIQQTRFGNHIPTTNFKVSDKIGNKSVFNQEELRQRYSNDRNLLVIEMLYYGYFGEGNNVNMDWLDRNGYWGNTYPALIPLNSTAFKSILEKGNIDVSNVIID